MLPNDQIFPQPQAHENLSSTIPIITLPTSQIFLETPPTVTQLPPRCRNEPAVLGCATGEVRRMRSVLDMKLGAMALSLDAHLTTPETQQFQHHPNLSDNSMRCAEVVDVFGIAIPASTQQKMSSGGWQEPAYRKSSNSSHTDVDVVSIKDDVPCSLFLAESPSRLDLSALLC